MSFKLIFAVISVLFFALIVIFIMVRRHKTKIQSELLKNIYDKYSRKTLAQIVSFKNSGSGRSSDHHYLIEIIMSYRSTPFRYIVKTNNKKAKKYEAKTYIPVKYIPACLDFYFNLISREKVFDTLKTKFDIMNQDIYPMIVFDDKMIISNHEQHPYKENLHTDIKRN